MITLEQNDYKKSKDLIIQFLKNNDCTTSQIIDHIASVSKDCKDKIPQTLLILLKEKKIKKQISKEKKGYIWSLIDI